MTEPHIRRMEAEEAKRAKRRETLDELRQELDRMHRKALKEEPYGQFVSKIPIGLLANLTPEERHQLDAFERQAYDRHRPISQAREQQRTAFVAAGGDAEIFDDFWETGGKEDHAAKVAHENLERARQENNIF